jgi:hypothetical protein
VVPLGDACAGYECKEFNGSFMSAFETAAGNRSFIWASMHSEKEQFKTCCACLFVSTLGICQCLTTLAGAVEWALTLQLALMKVPWAPELTGLHELCGDVVDGDDKAHSLILRGLRAKIGIHCGPVDRVVPSGVGRADYYGTPVNRAARLMSAAHGGQILCERGVMEQVAAEWALRLGVARAQRQGTEGGGGAGPLSSSSLSTELGWSVGSPATAGSTPAWAPSKAAAAAAAAGSPGKHVSQPLPVIELPSSRSGSLHGVPAKAAAPAPRPSLLRPQPGDPSGRQTLTIHPPGLLSMGASTVASPASAAAPGSVAPRGPEPSSSGVSFGDMRPARSFLGEFNRWGQELCTQAGCLSFFTRVP